MVVQSDNATEPYLAGCIPETLAPASTRSSECELRPIEERRSVFSRPCGSCVVALKVRCLVSSPEVKRAGLVVAWGDDHSPLSRGGGGDSR
jgi:hypothetical protein